MGQHQEDEYLLLSGIQHMAFCPRQWALIHIEQLWAENDRTVDGKHLHERADDPYEVESRGDLFVSRSMPIRSESLKLQGVADVVEFWRTDEDGVTIPKKKGKWRPVPIEYKRGQQKIDDRDRVQLCAQAICLEEMLGVHISEGFLFYGKTRRRENVPIDEELRKRVHDLSDEMYRLFRAGITPPASSGKHCQLCSLIELCVPKLTNHKSVSEYLDLNLVGDET